MSTKYLIMSDLEISGSDSEPVSDVNPEEMARLVAVSANLYIFFRSIYINFDSCRLHLIMLSVICCLISLFMS